jgi:UDP-N-acetylglucosamine 2-epimerase (non-hydrolysing)
MLFMLKVMTIVGTRPELIKMSRVIAELDANTSHILVHTGQNYDYELNQVFFDDLGMRKPDHFLNAVGDNAAQTIGQVIMKADDVLALEQPDAVMLYGDTNSCLAVISAKRRKIPVFHMEAGNRSFDQRVPEELNRKILDHLSDINLVLSEHARRYLLDEGVRPETIIKTGSHMREVLDYYLPKIKASDVVSRLGLKPREYFIVSAHREENVDFPENLQELVATLNGLAETFGFPVIVSTHPRTRMRLDDLGAGPIHSLVQFAKPFGFFDYNKLQLDAYCVVSDSGTITEEASLLNLPAITIRNAHERPEGMDEAIVVMSGLRRDRVIDAVNLVVKHHSEVDRVIGPIDDYEEKFVSKKIMRIVLSYVDYVNRFVWRKMV